MTNRSLDSPLMERAAMTAEGPGAVVTLSPASITAATARPPGSEIPGVPASLMRTTSSPARTRATICSLWAASLCSCRDWRRRPVVMSFALKSSA